MNENDKWWCHLKVTEKERIASKVEGINVYYPFCTKVWNDLSEDKKTWIRNHCQKKHGLIEPNWGEGTPFSY